MTYKLCGTWAVLLVACGIFLGGCGQKLRIASVPRETVGADGIKTLTFDMHNDGKSYYREILDSAGQVRYQQFDRDGDGEYEEVLDRATLDPNETRHIFLFLDGVPYSLMDEMWREGHFRLFGRPGHLVSTFPSLTDPAYYKIFHCGLPFGYEAEFCDRTTGREVGGVGFYLSGKNEAWVCGVDHRINFIEDAVMYLWPGGVFKREMVTCQKVLDKKKGDDRVVLYLLSTDGVCHMFPWDKAKGELAGFDRWVRQMVYEAGGKVHLTMLADHGNNFVSCKFLDIRKILSQAGLHVGERLAKEGDVVAPRFGLINFAGICVYGPNEQRRAIAALMAEEGIEAMAWKVDGGVRVANRQGTAIIRRQIVDDESMYSYEALQGDPLHLVATLAELKTQNLVRPDGFITDAAWFDATKAGEQPFAVPRIYGALHYDVQNPADIVISLADGYFAGDPALTKWVNLGGTHGGLSRASTVSFLMSSAFAAPEYVRPQEVLPLINQYVTWTPHIGSVDYSWLEVYQEMQGHPCVTTTSPHSH